MLKKLFKTKRQAKQLKALCAKYDTPTEKTTTNESILNYKPCILSMICVDDWTGKIY